MSIKKEILKTAVFIFLLVSFIIYRVIFFAETNKFFLIFITILVAIIYLLSLKNDLSQIKNKYDDDINKYNKNWSKQVEKTQKDLRKRGMFFSGEAVKKLGSMSALTQESYKQPTLRGELEIGRDDYKKYKTKELELDFQKAKYKVIINLLKKLNL